MHLTRETRPVAESWAKRAHTGMMNAYRFAILWHCPKDATPLDVALDYCDTVEENIRLVLRDKRNRIDFPLGEFDVRHNATWDRRPESEPGPLTDFRSKLYRIVRKLPVFLRNA